MKKIISLSIDEELLKQLDETRGKIKRSTAIEAAIFNELTRKRPQIKTIQEMIEEEELKEEKYKFSYL